MDWYMRHRLIIIHRALGMLSGGYEYVTEFQFSICHVSWHYHRLVTSRDTALMSRDAVTIRYQLRQSGFQYYGLMVLLLDWSLSSKAAKYLIKAVSHSKVCSILIIYQKQFKFFLERFRFLICVTWKSFVIDPKFYIHWRARHSDTDIILAPWDVGGGSNKIFVLCRCESGFA